MTYASVNGLRLYYEVHGNGRPLVLLHGGLMTVALNWAPASRALLGMAMSAVLLIPAAAFLITLVRKLAHPTTPDAAWLSLAGLGALVVNLSCAFLLARHRAQRPRPVRGAAGEYRRRCAGFAEHGIGAAEGHRADPTHDLRSRCWCLRRTATSR